MGALPHPNGVAFRVWAPHAEAVFVTGSFNGWREDAHPMRHEAHGYWYADIDAAAVGDEYRFLLVNGAQRLSRIDPYAREVTSSVGNGVIYGSRFDWGGQQFRMAPWNELVIYEMHVGTFHRDDDDTPGSFAEAATRLAHLRRLGVNAVQLMPVAEFAGDLSWGYNPAHIFAVESSYGGPDALKAFVRDAHAAGIAVILDVVYNHFGPSDLDLWQFDGWQQNGGGGIYFYNDWRAESPWGATRPDYGRPEVRRFIRDNAMTWLEDFRLDGLRFDMTLFIRSVRGDGDPGAALADGWSLLADLNREIGERFPGRLTIAEDLQNDPALTAPVDAGGAGFGSQWDAAFVHPVRAAVTAPDDAGRSMPALAAALAHRYNDAAFQRVVYSESHDEVANGKARVPHEIDPGDAAGRAAQKRSTLAAGLVFCAPGIPMLFQGQEFLQGGWFQDTVPLDWDQRDDYRGIVRLYRDLIRLRRNAEGDSRGLCGQGFALLHLDDDDKLLAFHRWDRGGPGDDVVVVANFSHRPLSGYRFGWPRPGRWTLRLNSDWRGYSEAFDGQASGDVDVGDQRHDGEPPAGTVDVAPYSLLLFTQPPARSG